MHWLEMLIGPDEGTPTIAQFCARALLLFFYGLLCIRIAGRRTFSSGAASVGITAPVTGTTTIDG